MDHSREMLLVDRDRAKEARRIIDTEVRPQMEQMGRDLGASSETSPEDTGLEPFGWLSPDVARELIAQLTVAGIRAEAEYPLDEPPPPYARADGRVRVHIEALFFDEASDMLDNEVRDALAARGITPDEPLLGDDL